MWLPVAQGTDISRGQAMSAVYWGTSLVLFRTKSGQLGALRDACGHRGIRLSKGDVCGEAIRCPFHHFQFNARGQCVAIPSVMQVADELRASCHVQPIGVYEEHGLIWCSFVPTETAPRPSFPTGENRSLCFRQHEVDGELLAWWDHWLDIVHLFMPHLATLFDSPACEYGDDRIAEQIVRMHCGETTSLLEVRGGLSNIFMLLSQSGGVRALLSKAVRFIATHGLGKFRQAVFGNQERKVLFNAESSHVCTQHLRIDFLGVLGSCGFDLHTYLNPISQTRHQITFLVVFDSKLRGLLRRYIERVTLNYICNVHVLSEDYEHIASTSNVDINEYFLTPFDTSTVATRQRAYDFAANHRQYFPADSLVHSLLNDPRLLRHDAANMPPPMPIPVQRSAE